MNLTRYQRPDLWSWPHLGDELTTLRDEINRLFESPLSGARPSEVFNVWSPPVDVYENKDNLVVRVELPGMSKDQIDVSVHQNTLTISGQREESRQADCKYTRSERFTGRFLRSLGIPKPIESDKVKAAYSDGVLTITLPKTEESKPRRIEVGSQQS
jgi:HSP20 family protein